MTEPHCETSSRDGKNDDRVRDLSRTTKDISVSKANDKLPDGVPDTYKKRTAVSVS